MLTLDEIIELRNKLSSNQIDLETAKNQYWANHNEDKRSWHTKDWQQRRLQFLKDKCQICSSTDTLTIQHLSHPKKYAEFEREVIRKYTYNQIEQNNEIDQTEFTNYILEKYEYHPVLLCPNCSCKNPSERKRKTPKYRCTDCKSEFGEATFKTLDELVAIFYKNAEAYEVVDKCFISKDKWRNINNLKSIKYWMQRENTKQSNTDIIGKEVFLLYLDDNIKYLSFEDTITACRRCAYHYDITRMNLCPQCNQQYKSIQYPTCIDCLPEDQRKKALETIEFYKEMADIHKNLGID